MEVSMGSVPGVGTVRGVFELFLPGIFLLLNFVGAVYSSPLVDLDSEAANGILWASKNLLAATFISIPLGYLIGVILRLFKTDPADNWSAAYLRLVKFLIRKRVKKEHKTLIYSKDIKEQKLAKNALLYLSNFPYNEWLEYTVNSMLPIEAIAFFKKAWANHSDSKQFINFCKIIVIAKNPTAGAEISSAEALSRFVASMMYAQLASLGAFAISLIFGVFMDKGPEIWVPIVMLGYIVGIWAILRSLRFLRLKEAEAIFSATFAIREQFAELEPSSTQNN
jgi:hypothetical protein